MLPSGGSKRDNGVGNIGGANTSVVLTLVWLVASVLIILFGAWHCRVSSFRDSFKCNELECRLLFGDNRDAVSKYVIHRSDLTHIEIVRVDDDNIVVNWYHLPTREVNKLGHNVELKFMHSTDPDSKYQIQKQVLLSHRDMGKLKATQFYKQVHEYMNKKRDVVNIVNESHVSMLGVLSITFGGISMVMSCILGQWSDPVPRRQKKLY